MRYWLPRLPAAPQASQPEAVIDVRLRERVPTRPEGGPAMLLDPVGAWPHGEAGFVLRSRDGEVTGAVDLEALEASLEPTERAAHPHALPDEPRNAAVFSGLTLASALLLNRMGRALVHGAAVVAPDGRAWLLVGDAFAGKTTTTVNLIQSGWDWVSDDTVVLRRGPAGEVVVEGWPRAFHLDRGYESGRSTGERDTVEPGDFGPGGWRRSAPVAGVLFPRVEPELPTTRAPIAAADALSRLVRQSPWLLADPAVANDVLALLTATVSSTNLELRLGQDCYRNPERLVQVLSPAVGI